MANYTTSTLIAEATTSRSDQAVAAAQARNNLDAESFEMVDTMVDAPIPEKKDSTEQVLDLVFLLDCTGSMGSYIAAAKENVERIIHALARAQGYDLRLGLVGYRDHPPQDNSYVTRSFPFTSSVDQMSEHLAQLSAAGGGDGPEAVEAGLLASLEMDWRERATKIVILIADAPPHGLGERGDGFPNGAPTGVDPLVVLDALSVKGVCVYSVGCEPALSNYRFARDFFVAVAERTNGQAVSLSSASALADVILGASIEECELERLTTEVERQVRSLQLAEPSLAEAEIEARVCADLQARGALTRQMQCSKLSSSNSHFVCRAASLPEAKKSLASVPTVLPLYRSLESTCKRSSLVTSGVPLSLPGALPFYRGFGFAEGDDGDDLETWPTEDAPVYRSLSFDEELMEADEAPTYRSLCAPLALIPGAAASAESKIKLQHNSVTVTEGVISKEQVARLFSRGKKKGLWGGPGGVG